MADLASPWNEEPKIMRTTHMRGDDGRAAGPNRAVQAAGVLASIVILLASVGCAAPPAGSNRVDPDAAQALRKMADTLDGASAYRFRVSAVTDRPTETGQLAQFHRTSEITVARPDRVYERTDADEGDWSAWYDGNNLTVLARDTNVYATEDVPGRIDRMLDHMADEYGLVMPMADLMAGGTYDSLLANVESGSYIGLHTVGDRPCHHLLMRQENIDWQIWIDAGQPPVPRKLVITFKQEPGQPQYVATTDEWDFSPDISPARFEFTPPADAKAISMPDLLGLQQEEQP